MLAWNGEMAGFRRKKSEGFRILDSTKPGYDSKDKRIADTIRKISRVASSPGLPHLTFYLLLNQCVTGF